MSGLAAETPTHKHEVQSNARIRRFDVETCKCGAYLGWDGKWYWPDYNAADFPNAPRKATR